MSKNVRGTAIRKPKVTLKDISVHIRLPRFVYFFHVKYSILFFSPSRKSIIARWYFPEENKSDHRETRFSGPVWGLEDNFLSGGWGQES